MRYARDEFQVESAQRKGRALPEWYLEEPEPSICDKFYLKSFFDLSTCRSIGMGIGPIPWTAMTEYARYLNLDRDVTEAFVDIMREMDNAYVEYQTAEQKRLSELSKAKPPNKGTP